MCVCVCVCVYEGERGREGGRESLILKSAMHVSVLTVELVIVSLVKTVHVCMLCNRSLIIVITLCAYAQQGYVFGRVGLCMYVYVDKKMGCLESYHQKIFR